MTRSKQEILEWLQSNLGAELERDAASISADAKFTELGVDSISMLAIAGDLEQWLGLTVLPSMLWEHSTLEQLAAALAQSPRV